MTNRGWPSCAFLDLDVPRRGRDDVMVPEASPHTSITTRTEHVKAQGRAGDLKQAEHGSITDPLHRRAWRNQSGFARFEDRRELDSSREGMLPGFSLGNYRFLVDFTARLFREGKTAISTELSGILERLGTTAESWQARPKKLKSGRLLGRFFAASQNRLREAAVHLRVHHLANLGGCPSR